MRRSGIVVCCGTMLLVSALLTGAVAAQLGSGYTTPVVEPPLSPSPLPAAAPVEPAAVEVTELDVTTRRGATRARLATPVGGADVAVVLIAGSGGSDRYAMSVWADQLAARGIAAISYDKRLADYSGQHRDYPALARDAVDVVAATRRSTSAARVGLLGFSEGGWIAPFAAAEDPTIDFLVLASPVVVTPLEQVSWIVDQRLSRGPTLLRKMSAATLASGRPYLDYLDTDIRTPLAGRRVPILAVWGADDAVVPVAVAARRLPTSASPATEVVLSGVGHHLGGSEWPAVATDWIQAGTPSRGADVLGAEPTTHLGVGSPPVLRAYAQPPVQLAVSVAATAVVALLLRRRRRWITNPLEMRNVHVNV